MLLKRANWGLRREDWGLWRVNWGLKREDWVYKRVSWGVWRVKWGALREPLPQKVIHIIFHKASKLGSKSEQIGAKGEYNGDAFMSSC